ncbi:MAG: Asp-tRNA(Asn)/Glu-tRNA(Gln) amidotransferase subunit GatB, partial [SAR202 cluster bacterium]|nr:Asp-tRNA(Asn)/Glu-tRNA(Gln) amidotransferase subunit GatB [SAR202 cluster bacterium]
RSADEAREYLIQLHSILQFIGTSVANMEEGNFRCDANVSIRPMGDEELGTKVEVKNMNSFRSVHRAIEFEVERQTALLESGGRIEQETRGWVDDEEITVSQRTKEYASDYRYFPEPDLPPVTIDPTWVEEIRESLPELPVARRARFVAEMGLSEYDAELLTVSRAAADYFETALNSDSKPSNEMAKAIGNWMLGEMAHLQNQTGTTLENVKIAPGQLVELQKLVDGGTLSSTMAKDVFEKMYSTGAAPQAIAESEGLVQISDSDAVGAAIDEAVGANPQPVQDYLEGKESAIQFLVGQVMRITRGKANPQVTTELLKAKLEAMR